MPLLERWRSSRLAYDRFIAIKIFFVGVLVLLVGELSNIEGLSRLGIWTVLAAFPVAIAGEILNFVLLMKDADE